MATCSVGGTNRPDEQPVEFLITEISRPELYSSQPEGSDTRESRLAAGEPQPAIASACGTRQAHHGVVVVVVLVSCDDCLFIRLA